MKLKTDFRADISFYKRKQEKLETKLLNELKKLDKTLDEIRKFINKHRHLDIEQLIEVIIFKGLVTKDKLTKFQLYESTKALVEDFLAEDLDIETIEDS